MKSISKIIKEQSLLAVPIIIDIKGNDVQRHKRADWVEGCEKGFEIMNDFMKTLKDFDTWKEWKNTNPIIENEWDDSHELNNVMNNIIDELDEWYVINDSVLYEEVLYKTQELIPIDDGVNDTHRHCVYQIDDYYYKLTWSLKNNDKIIIEQKIKFN
jgi:hypothetical protein